MISYEEITQLAKTYRYSYDYNTQKMKVIQKGDKDKKELSQSPETDRIKVALLVKAILDNYYAKGTDEDKKNGLKELQENIIKATTDGKYSFTKILFQKRELFEYFMDESFHTTDREDPSNQVINIENREESALSFMNICLADIGKKVEKVEAKHSSNDLTRRFNFSSRNLSFSEKINPNNQTYTQQPKPIVLSPEQVQRRREFVNKLMQIYKQCETDENYSERASNEERDMAFVVKSINSNTAINGITQVKRLMDLLYAAQNVSLTGQRDFLSELINQPQISSLLLKMRDGNALDRMSKLAQNRQNSGTVSEHKQTYGETAIKRANELYI